MNTVLITGGAGFIGANLARYLQERDYRVIALDDLSLGWPANVPDGVTLISEDVTVPDDWRQVPDAGAVIHLAAASSSPMFADDLPGCFENNVVGFVRVLEYARRVGAGRVLYASTSSIYGNAPGPLREAGPIDIPNFYAVSKFCMEQIARVYQLQYGLDVVGFRFMSVYGPRERHKGQLANLVSQFVWEVLAGRPPVIYGDGTQTRDFTSVWDVCQALQLALEHRDPLGHAVFNIGTGCETSLNELVHLLSELTGKDVTPRYVPNPVGGQYVNHQLASLDVIHSVLGYEPRIALREGVEEILNLG